MVKITVLMSVYNSEKWLKECIQSVLDSIYEDFEFVIVDDGSTDSSSDIINSFALKDKRIVIAHQENKGLAAALNYGLKISTGEWIARIDADDMMNRERLKKQIFLAENTSNAIVIFSDSIEIDENGQNLRYCKYPTRSSSLKNNLLFLKRFPCHSSALIKTEVLKSVDGYREFMQRSQDWDLWYRLLNLGSFESINEPLVKSRQHESQLSSGKGSNAQKRFVLIAKICQLWRSDFGTDPIDSGQFNFEEFSIHVLNYFEKTNYFKNEKQFDQLTKIRTNNNSKSLKLNLIFYFIKNPKMIFLLTSRKIFGIYINKKIVRKINRDIFSI